MKNVIIKLIVITPLIILSSQPVRAKYSQEQLERFIKIDLPQQNERHERMLNEHSTKIIQQTDNYEILREMIQNNDTNQSAATDGLTENMQTMQDLLIIMQNDAKTIYAQKINALITVTNSILVAINGKPGVSHITDLIAHPLSVFDPYNDFYEDALYKLIERIQAIIDAIDNATGISGLNTNNISNFDPEGTLYKTKINELFDRLNNIIEALENVVTIDTENVTHFSLLEATTFTQDLIIFLLDRAGNLKTDSQEMYAILEADIIALYKAKLLSINAAINAIQVAVGAAFPLDQNVIPVTNLVALPNTFDVVTDTFQTAVQACITRINTMINAYNQVSAMISALVDLTTELQNFDPATKLYTTALNELVNRINGLKNQLLAVTEIESNNLPLDQEVFTVMPIQDHIIRLLDEDKNCIARIEILENDLDVAEANITTLQTNLGTANADITILQTDLDAAEADIGTLQTNVETIQNNVPAHIAKVNEIVEALGVIRTALSALNTVTIPLTLPAIVEPLSTPIITAQLPGDDPEA